LTIRYGLAFIPAARGALIFATLPLLTLLFAVALGRERLTPAKTAGVLLTIGGVAAAVGEKALAFHGDTWVGELAVLGSALCGAVCSVLYRPYVRKYLTVPVSAFAMLASVRVTVFLSLSPITAAILGALLLGERVSSMIVVALACVVAGLWLAHKD
jgi:drug/metabolite transporter (DMT)-like permease